MKTHFCILLFLFIFIDACSCDDNSLDSNPNQHDDIGDAGCRNCVIEETCNDGVLNQNEESIDCGGICEACPPVETCDDGLLNQNEEAIDCGGVCEACPPVATCDDGVLNQDEEGIDCGGSCEACPPVETCDDGILNQDEEDIDCGGSCEACPPVETCDDGILNQNEVGIDCGGSCRVCPTCDDAFMNQDEEGIDCGGSCAACPATPECVTTDDCSGDLVCVENGCTSVPFDYIKRLENTGSGSIGTGVALSDNILVMGSPSDRECPEGHVLDGPYAYLGCNAAGSVQVFEKLDGVWQQTAFLKAHNFDAHDFFGRQIVIDGERIAVGAQSEAGCSTEVNMNGEYNGCRQAGAVYIFEKQENGEWLETAYIKPNIAAQNTFFGQGLALSGDMLIVGAPGEDSCSNEINSGMTNHDCEGAGAVFVFEEIEGIWVQTNYIKGSHLDSGDAFGGYLDYDAGLLAVGSRNDDSCSTTINIGAEDNSCENVGAVYLFEVVEGTWNEVGYLKASNAEDRDQVGRIVSISEGRVLATARYEDGCGDGVNPLHDNDCADSGAAYVFSQQNGVWEQEAYLKPLQASEGQQFAWYATLEKSRAVISSFRDPLCGAGIGSSNISTDCEFSGTAYIFGLRNDGWRLDGYIKSPNSDPGDKFGTSLAVHHQQILIGATGEDSCSNVVNIGMDDNECPDTGAGYLYDLTNLY